MRTSITDYFKSQLFGVNSTEVGISLIDIACASFPQTYHVCDNNEDVTSNGVLYNKYAFEMAFVDEAEGEIPSNTVLLDNTDTTILEALLSADPRDDITITYRFIAASDPDYNQLGRDIVYTVSGWRVDESNITADLTLALIANEAFPAHGFYPATFPGLFGGRV